MAQNNCEMERRRMRTEKIREGKGKFKAIREQTFSRQYFF